MLGAHGYEVESARHAAEALRMARAAPPALLIADPSAPAIEGYPLLEHWKSDAHLMQVPFMVYAARAAPDDEARALRLGTDAFVVAPCAPEDFIARVRAAEARSTAATLDSAALLRGVAEKAAELDAANRALRREIAQHAQRALADARLVEINMRLETLVREARIGILVHDGYRPVMVNDELARIFGYADRTAILDMADCRFLFADDERPRISDYYAARLKGDSAPGLYIVRGKTRDGRVVELENRAFPMLWAGRTAVCAMLTDVTEQRRLEAQLRQAQRLEAIGQMTGGVAHDFNNLLTVIMGNAEQLEEGLGEGEPLRDLAQMTRMAAERGAELTSRLLAFSRRQALDPANVDINALIVNMDPLLRRALGAHIECATVCGPGLWRATIDAPQLESALLNLAFNARDAMPGGGRLTIETSNVQLDETSVAFQADFPPGSYVLVAVSDTGCGMNEETLLQAFDPFFTTKDVGKGSGLGLSMVYGFVRQSKGYVRLYSEPGQGTTVKLYLPRAHEEAGASPSPPRVSAIPGGSEKILVVEDDELVRVQVAAQLKTLGYEVVSASDGAQALDILRRVADFSLLFTDVVMPGGMNGRQLAEEARKLHPGLAVLFTSGYAENAIVHHGRLDPGVHLLNKPYRRLDLAVKIRAALEQARG
jgi:PAS domain S-box-containing protein